jgi:hypothetical protein
MRLTIGDTAPDFEADMRVVPAPDDAHGQVN